MMQGKFNMPDGTPGFVNVWVFGNVTQVTIIVNPAKHYERKHESVQFLTGFAYCHKSDVFRINTGIKVACKHALYIDGHTRWYNDPLADYHRTVYSAIRRAMRGEK